MDTIDKIAMYWGYFSFIGLVITLVYCIPFAYKDETPYQKQKKFWKKRANAFKKSQ